MRDSDIARRLLLAFGPRRFIVFGAMSEAVRHQLRDAGSEILEQGTAPDGMSRATWPADFLEQACVVFLDLPDDTLIAVLSDARLLHTQGAYIQHDASEVFGEAEDVERRAFALGYRKHPAYHRLFGYAELEQTSHAFATALEPVPVAAAARFPMPRLVTERDLHMDMLREAGRRADAHIVRYDWASKRIRPNDVVLDAACGLGYGTYVMRHLSAARRIYGIDASEWAIDYATSCFGDQDTEFIAGVLPDALRRFEDASVDVVVSFETLEHVAEPVALLDAFHRVLRPGGRVIVSVPNDWSDETGEDPNPHHLHVYTYERLEREIAAGFTLEQSVRQIASGCKRVDVHCQWEVRPRTLEAVEPANGQKTEAEWWLAVAMKSPEAGRDVPYLETVHGHFEGATHLVDFDRHYTNPWLVHAMVEIPFRLQRADALTRLAEQVRGAHSPDTADYGAALAVLCYRTLEAHAHEAQLERLDADIARYLTLAVDNPHVRRWQISLAYARARLRLRRGDRHGALADFSAVATADVTHITPTLGTKVIDAAFRAGTLCWLVGAQSDARDWWRQGLAHAGRLVGTAWLEFFGNADAPFVFAMNDAVEIVDRATACAQALSLTQRPSRSTAARLHGVGEQSLRSALRQREEDLGAARAELASTQAALTDTQASAVARLEAIVALEKRIEQTDAALQHITAELHVRDAERDAAARLRDEFNRVCAELQAHSAQKADLERESIERLARIHTLEMRLRETNDALDEVKMQSVHRLEEKMALEARLERTDAALEALKQLSTGRMARVEQLEKQLQALTAVDATACSRPDSAAILTDTRAVPHLDSITMQKKTCVFTSAALNYIPKVRLLFRSLRDLHPELELHLALSDALPEDIDLSNEPFDEIHPLSTLDIPDVRGWAFCHNIVELSTAIKPFVLQKLLEREDVGRVLYFDPDMVLFSRVDDLLDALEHASVILTPHQVEPETHLRAVIDNEICSLKHGVYNLGFVGVSATDEGMRFAEWWKQRVYHFCRADIPHGLFTDQRWIDLVPAFFSNVAIVRSSRHNVAPWNLTTREITGSFKDGFKVNGEPLGFYHFTGFDSGAHRTMAAVNGRAGSQAGLLIDWYATETARLASDPLAQKRWAYGTYSNGEKVESLHRLIYRERRDLQRAFADPFDASDAGFHAWIRGQAKLEYPGIDGGPRGEALRQLEQQLTAGFAPNHLDSLQWRRIGRLTADAIGSPHRAGRYAKRAWEILKQEGLIGIKRRLV